MRGKMNDSVFPVPVLENNKLSFPEIIEGIIVC